MSREPMKSFNDKEFQQTKTQANAAISDAKDRISDMASNVKDKAGHMVDSVSEQIGHQRENAADGLHRAADAIHENAESIPGGPKVVKMTHTIADGMESTASYLRDHDLKKMGKDAVDVCRRYPTQALVAAVAIGFLIGRTRR